MADEYAPLYRKTKFQLIWAKMQRNIYSLMLKSKPGETVIDEILANLDQVGDYFKTIALGRLYNYFGSISDFPRAVECAKRSIEIGERSNAMMVAIMTYGFLARIALAKREKDEAARLIRLFLRHLKNDLECAGVREAVVCRGNRYFMLRSEIECDTELFEAATKRFQVERSKDAAQRLLALYKGEYLSDFEALWAVGKRIQYREMHEQALSFLTRG